MGDMLIEEPKETTFEVPGMLQTSFNKLFEFLQKEILCDVVIQAGNKSIKCHRNVLASCSPYFQAMFTSSLAESKQNVITIGDIDEITMEMLIKFAYTAKVDLNASNAQALLHASSVLQFDCLAQACCDFMSSQLHPTNCLGIRELAQRFGQLSLVKKSDSYTKYNFRKIIVEDEFVSISAKHLEEIISSEDLFVDNEVEVYEAVMVWVKHDVNKRKDLLPKLLSKVRLPLLPLAYLRMYVESDSLVRKNLECRDLLDEARHYQMWQVSHLPTAHLPVTERTRPRKSYAGNLIFYSFGGFENNVPLNSVEKYDPDSNKWSFVSPMKVGRGGVGAAALGRYIYAIGGHNATHYLNTVEIYDVQNDRYSPSFKWKSGPVISDYRAGAGVTWCSMGSELLKKLVENCSKNSKEESFE
ncbi:unnamed protein product [Larinioides sclopetarius]|uniref:BTB domain-containing protein n=1 Tax=Larinioides sclopetarius TaxID=280406 RepID=A0AAV1Z894_9ARAC